MNEPKKRTFTITEGPESGVSIDANDVAYLLVTAFDGGATNYWADRARVELPDNFDVKNITWLNDKDQWAEVRKVYIAPLIKDGRVILFGNESDDDEYVEDFDEDDEECTEDDSVEFGWTLDGRRFRRPQHILDLSAIERGLNVMSSKYRNHWYDFRTKNDDMITGDVFVQCCIFGECM